MYIKKTLLIYILILSMLLSSCGSTLPQSGKDTDTDSGDFGENTEEITPPETEKVPQNEKITVVCDEEYTEEIDEEYLYPGFPDTHHKIVIPKLTSESENAKKFNYKIARFHLNDAVLALQLGEEKDSVYNVDYIFEECNGIIGILITDFTSVIGSHKNANYYGFYYDTVNDRELDFFEYLEALGVDYAELISAVNSSITEYYPDESYALKGNFSDYEITAAIFSNSKAYVSLPSYGWGKVLGEYERSFVGRADKKYDVSIEDKLEIFYKDYKGLLNASPEGDIAHAFIVDYNGDSVPEILIEYCNPYLHGDYYKVFGIKDNDIADRGGSSYGPGIESSYSFILYEGRFGDMDFETSHLYNGTDDYFVSVRIHFGGEEELAWSCTFDCSVSDNYFAYQIGDDGDYVEISEQEFRSMYQECCDFADSHSPFVGDSGFRGVWELQKSILGM